MTGLTAALLLAATGGAAPKAAVVIPKPARSLSKIESMLDWMGLIAPEVAPGRLRRDLSGLGVDPFNARSWPGAGLTAGKPIVVWGTPKTAAVIDVRIKKTKAADAALKAAVGRRKTAQRIKGRRGFVDGRTIFDSTAMVRKDKRLLMQLGRKPAGSAPKALEALAALAGLEKKRRPKKRPSGPARYKDPRLAVLRAAAKLRRPPGDKPSAAKTRKNPDLWLLDLEDRRRGNGALWLRDDGFDGVFHFADRTATQVANSEITSSKARARPLLDAEALNPVVDAMVNLNGPAWHDAAEQQGVAAKDTQHLTGQLHVMLTDAGDLIAAGVLEKGVTPEQAEDLVASVQAAAREAQVKIVDGLDKDRVILLWLGKQAPADLTKAMLQKRPKADPVAVRVRIKPRRLLSAIQTNPAIARTFGLEPAHLMMAQLVVQPIMVATKGLDLSARFLTKRIEARVIVDY